MNEAWEKKTDYRILLDSANDSSVLHTLEILLASLLASVILAVIIL